MLNQILKWSLVLGIWRKYGSAIKWFPVLLLALFAIYAIHNDYVGYVEVSQEDGHLALSFLIKWLAILLVIAIYIVYARAVLNVSASSTRAQSKKVKKSQKKRQDSEQRSNNGADATAENLVDPFESIRRKSKLRTKADFILENENNKR